MKKVLLLFLALTTCAFADEAWYTHRYVKLGAGTTDAPNLEPGATAGGGVRIVTGHSGIDLGVDYAEHQSGDHLILGKGLYLFLLTPKWKTSLYAGLGMGYGRSKTAERDFVGIFGEGVLGYAIITHSPILAFIELGIHQPALATGGPDNPHHRTSGTVTFGVGF